MKTTQELPKRMLIASMMIDCGTQDNAFDIPVISWYYVFGEDSPIMVRIKFGWTEQKTSFPFSNYKKKKIGDKLQDTSMWYFDEWFPSPLYEGNRKITDVHISQFGKQLHSCRNEKHIVNTLIKQSK
jgi:hypothetical protein